MSIGSIATSSSQFVSYSLNCDANVIDRCTATSSTPPQPFSSLKTFLSGSFRHLSDNLFHIHCLEQNHGDSHCGIYALANAFTAHAVTKRYVYYGFDFARFPPTINKFFSIENKIFPSSVDQTESDLQKIRNEIISQKIDVFDISNYISPHPQPSNIEWKKEDLIFFQVMNNRLTFESSEGFESLWHLKELVEKPGPSCRAFVLGHQGHWSTLFYEKNENNEVSWFNLDSENRKDPNRFETLVKILSKGMEDIDALALRQLDQKVGDCMRRATAKLKEDGELSDENKKNVYALIQDSITLFEHMGWMQNPPENLVFVDLIDQSETILTYLHSIEPDREELKDLFAKINSLRFPPHLKHFTPLELEIEILNLHTPPKSPFNKIIESFRSLPEISLSKSEFLRLVNANYDGEIRLEMLKCLEHYISLGCIPFLERVSSPRLTQENQIENLKLLDAIWSFGLLSYNDEYYTEGVKNILNGHVEPLLASCSDPSQTIVLALNRYLVNNPSFHKSILLILTDKLLSESDPYQARSLALKIDSKQTLLWPGEEEKKLKKKVQRLAEELVNIAQITIEKTAPEMLRSRNNPWNVYRMLKLKRKRRPPFKFPFIYQDRQFAFKPSSGIEACSYRGDLHPDVSPEMVKALFNRLEERVRANPLLGESALTVAGESSFPPNETHQLSGNFPLRKFLLFKNRFFSDPVLKKLMELPTDSFAPISNHTYCFYSLIQNCLARNSTPENEITLSEQERYFYYFMNAVDGCPAGKEEKAQILHGLYVAPTQKNKDLVFITKNQKHPLFSFFTPIFSGFSGYIFHAKQILKSTSVLFNAEIHEKRLIDNRYSHITSLSQPIQFDWFVDFRNKFKEFTQHKFQKCFCDNLNVGFLIQRYLDGIQVSLQTELIENERLVRMVAQYNRARMKLKECLISEEKFLPLKNSLEEEISRQNESSPTFWNTLKILPSLQSEEGENPFPTFQVESLASSILDLLSPLGLLSYEIFNINSDEDAIDREDYEPGDECKIEGLKPDALIHIAKQLGILEDPITTLKFDPERPISTKKIVSMVQQIGTVTTLDLTGCKWFPRSSFDYTRLTFPGSPVKKLIFKDCFGNDSSLIYFLYQLNNLTGSPEGLVIDMTGACTTKKLIPIDINGPSIIDETGMIEVAITNCPVGKNLDTTIDEIIAMQPLCKKINLKGCVSSENWPNMDVMDNLEKKYPGINFVLERHV